MLKGLKSLLTKPFEAPGELQITQDRLYSRQLSPSIRKIKFNSIDCIPVSFEFEGLPDLQNLHSHTPRDFNLGDPHYNRYTAKKRPFRKGSP